MTDYLITGHRGGFVKRHRGSAKAMVAAWVIALAVGFAAGLAAPPSAHAQAASGVGTVREPLLPLRSMTQADRQAAAKRLAEVRAATEGEKSAAKAAPVPGGQPDYMGGIYSNYANSPIIRKFVDGLPGLGAANANNLGQYIPIANADTITFPGSDYYEIGVIEYTEQMNSDLPLTTLRGYIQLNNGTNAVTQLNTVAPAPVHYLGPVIIAQKDRPVRIKFSNLLPTGAGGDLFIPVDTTVMGAGMGPLSTVEMYTQNRATLHLHGGRTPWISDGTPHQWITPAGEVTSYPEGVSVENVPDMFFDATGHVVPAGTPGATTDPGPGSQTFYYTNQQCARLMFYHDHSYGMTRLNVYAGEAAGYLVTDPTEENLISVKKVIPALGGVYHLGVPLIIQDRTFVDATTIAGTDPTWNWGTTPPIPNTGDLWFPHVYMPNQNPYDVEGANAMGRLDYGPWFWPPYTAAAGLINGPIPLPDGTEIPGTPNPSLVPEAFMDTPIVNGTAYPVVPVQRTAYRFRILNACNDRFLNLQLYYAEPLSVLVTAGGSGYFLTPTVTFSGGGATTQGTGTAIVAGAVSTVTVVTPGAGYTSSPEVTFTGGGGLGATATATVDTIAGTVTAITVTAGGRGYTTAPTVTLTGGGATTLATATATITGVVVGITVTSPGVGYTSAPTVTITDATGTGTGATAVASVNTEVKMVPAVPHPAYDPLWPATWPTDGRDGGVPDPTTAGPDIIQIGTEGGFLPAPVDIPSTPIGYNYNRRDIVVLNVITHGLFLGPAERADVIVDFSQVPAGVTDILLYNDAPAPVPAFDPRNDYYTGDPDFSYATGDGTGGAPTTLPGYGPNTRTIMKFQVAAGVPAPAGFNLAALQAAWPAAYAASQPAPIVPETAYPAPYKAAANTYVRIQDNTITFPAPGNPVLSVSVTAGGSGYTSAPAVTFSGGGGTRASAVTHITNAVNTVTVTNGGTGYTAIPTVAFSGGGGTGAAATASIAGGAVTAVTVTNGGKGYTSAPTVTLVGGEGSGATAAASITGVVNDVTLLFGGTGYTSAPTVVLTGGGGTGAAATANLTVTFALQPKAIQELFETNYGRMNATFGIELPFTNAGNQTTIPYGYIDPPTEILQNNGRQVWKITHNGVDTHAIHFHLFDVQLINRVGWDGMIKPPEPNELGWKETVRMNPLEDAIVAFRPTAPTLPFSLPDSVRPLDVTSPLGSTMGFWPQNPQGQPVTVVNTMTNFGWEYVWHCHLLGHEENDMMRPVIFQVPPGPPTNVTAVAGNKSATVSFTPPATGGSPITLYTVTTNPGGAQTTGLVFPKVITGLTNGTPYTFTVKATNAVGIGPASLPSNVVIPSGPPAAPSNLVATPSVLSANPPTVLLTWTDNSLNETQFRVQRATNSTFTTGLAFFFVGANVTSYTDVTVSQRRTFYYRAVAINGAGMSGYSNTASALTPGQLPAAPTNLTLVSSSLSAIAIRWTDNATNEQGFRVYRQGPSGTWSQVAALPVNTTTYTSPGPYVAGSTYSFIVQAYNADGVSANSNWLAVLMK